jgi:hypothetical protein
MVTVIQPSARLDVDDYLGVWPHLRPERRIHQRRQRPLGFLQGTPNHMVWRIEHLRGVARRDPR